jgi:Tol biopolymer transport system component
MRRTLTTVHCLLITSFLFLLSSCFPNPQTPLQTSLLFYRFDHPAFVQYSSDLQPVKEIPFSIPPSCGLNNTFAAPVGRFLLIELNCPNGQTVLFLDISSSLSASSGSITQPITDTDAHFLAWTSDGKAAYLKVDSLGNPHIIRAYTDGSQKNIPVTEFTYDLSAKPDSNDFTFTFSRGMGQGSELWLAQRDGKAVQQLFADPFNYISFARWSPDGSQIAFIKTPDSQTPFTVGELWVMDADGSNPRQLADVDTGHGFAANWSPDGKWIAFVARENPEDVSADQNNEALISNILVMDEAAGISKQVTTLTKGRAETPLWSPDGNTLAFNVVVDGRMEVQIADIATGEIRSLIKGSTCCPAWMRK